MTRIWASRTPLVRRTLPAVIVAGVLAAIAPPPSSAAVLTAQTIGRLPRFPTEILKRYGAPPKDDTAIINTYGMIVLMPGKRLLFQGFRLGNFKSAVLARDLDSYSVRRILDLDADLSAAGIAGADWIHAVDERRGRLFLGWRKSDLSQGYYTIDTRTFDVRSTELPLRDETLIFSGHTNLGMTYDARTDRLYVVLGQPTSPLFHPQASPDSLPTLILAMRASAPAGQELEYVRLVRSCRSFWPTQAALYGERLGIPIISNREGDGVWRLHVPCGTRSSVVGVVRLAADPEVVGTIARDPTESVTVGPPDVYNIIADPGSGRMAMIAQAGSAFERVAWLYDAASASFIGLFRASGPGESCGVALACQGFGLDPGSGRLFGLSQGLGLFSSSIRLNPVPQAVTYQGYVASPGNKRIWYDPVRNLLYVLRPDRKTSTVGVERHLAWYDVVRPSSPPPAPPPIDPDRFTLNRPEGEDTRTSFSASGSAFGLRVLFARGLNGANPAPDAVNQNVNDILGNKCGFTDRSLIFSFIDTSTLSDSAAGARAVELDTDARTKVDLERPSRCDTESVIPDLSNLVFDDDRPPGNLEVPGSNERFPAWFDQTVGRAWTREPAECVAADDTDESRRSSEEADIGTATVACEFSKQRVRASTRGHVSLGELRIASSSSELTITRRASKGATARADSVARGILLGDIALGEVRTIAEATAGGRPGTAKATFVRRILGVAGPGIPPGTGCENQGCDQLIDRLNAIFAGRAQFRLPQPSPFLCRRPKEGGSCEGTPGGAQAGILKSVFQRESDNALSGDSSWEIPGLEVIIYNDQPSLGRARQLIQFAGVRADTSYNISLVPTGTGFGPDIPTDVLGGAVEPPSLPELGAIDVSGAAPAAPESPVVRIVRPIAQGVRFFFASPSNALRVGTAWVLLMSPAVIAARRRRLRLLESADK